MASKEGFSKLRFDELCGSPSPAVTVSRADVSNSRADVSGIRGEVGVQATNVVHATTFPHSPVVPQALNLSAHTPVIPVITADVNSHASKESTTHASSCTYVHRVVSDTRTDVVEDQRGRDDGVHMMANVDDPKLIAKPKGRVSVWDRLNPKVSSSTEIPTTFAKIVGSIPEPELTFFPVDEKEERVHIPVSMTKGMASTFSTVVMGYFLGPRLHFQTVLKAVKNAWGRYGFRDAMVNELGYFFFRFNDIGGCLHVVESSPLMINGIPLFVTQWDPSKGLHKPIHTMCPLWVRLFNVPLVAFNKEGLSRIASAIGVPLRMDACTASTCDNLWGRTAFAKVLINVWAKGTLKREVEVVIPKLSGEGEDVVTVVVEYDWEPSQCSICKVFGHRDSGCVNGIPRKDNPQPIDKDGFQRQRKQHWKPTARKGNPPSPKSATLKSKDGSSSPVGVVSMGGGKQSQIQTEPIIKETKGPQKEGGASMSKPNSSGLGGGAFCTVNAGHTPCGKDGPPNRIPLKEKGPEMVKSVVNTFKQQLKPRRGIMISDDSTNRFSPLSSDDSSDEVDVSVIGKSNINGAGISGVKTSQGVVIDDGIVENISK